MSIWHTRLTDNLLGGKDYLLELKTQTFWEARELPGMQQKQSWRQENFVWGKRNLPGVYVNSEDEKRQRNGRRRPAKEKGYGK